MASPNAPRGALSTLSPSQSKQQQQQLQADHHHHHDRVVVPMSLRPHGDDGPSPPSKHSDFDWPELRAIRPIPTSPQGELSATSSLEPIRGAQVAPDTAVPSAPSNLQLLKRRSQSPTQGIARLTRLAEPRHRVPSMVRYPHPPLQAEAAAAIPKPTFVNPHAPVPTVPAAEPPLRAAPRQLPFLARDRSAHRESPHRGGMPTRDLTAVAPRLQHEIDDYDRHRRRAEARSAAVDKRVQMMLREIEKQRESIERVIEKQDMDFEHRLNAQHAQVAADQAARKETVKKRQEAHLERMTKLKVDRRVHAVPPLASGPGRFGPDRSQPTAAAVARGTSIGVQPATSQPYTTDSPLSHAQRSPSPLRQASPTPSPQLVEYAVAPVARVMASIAHEQDTVMAAEERFRRAEAERIEAERALRLAQRRAVATRLLETQRAAAEILQAPLRTVQSFVGYQLSLRAARAAVLRIVQRRSDDAVSSSSSSSSGYGDDEEEDDDGDTDDENLDYQSEPTTRTTADGSPALSTVASLAQMKPTRDDDSRAPRRRSVTIAADELRMEQEEAAASADGSSSPPHLFSSGTVPPHIMESLLEKCSPVQRGGTPVDSSSDSDPDLADARETEAQLCLVEILEFALLTRMREAYYNMNAE